MIIGTVTKMKRKAFTLTSRHTEEGAFLQQQSCLISLPIAVLEGIILSGYLPTTMVLKKIRSVCCFLQRLISKKIVIVDAESSTINDVGILKVLRHAEQIYYLNLGFTQVKSFMWKINTSKLESLRYLSLRGAEKVTDKSLKSIGLLQSLVYLDVSKSKSEQFALITDVSLVGISSLRNLWWLNLGGTAVTDDGIRQLCCDGLTAASLRYLGLGGCIMLTDGIGKHLAQVRCNG